MAGRRGKSKTCTNKSCKHPRCFLRRAPAHPGKWRERWELRPLLSPPAAAARPVPTSPLELSPPPPAPPLTPLAQTQAHRWGGRGPRGRGPQSILHSRPNEDLHRAPLAPLYRDRFWNQKRLKLSFSLVFLPRAPPRSIASKRLRRRWGLPTPGPGPGPSSPMERAPLSRDSSPKLLPGRWPPARPYLRAVPPGNGLGKPQEKRASERRHQRDSHGLPRPGP